MPKETAPKTISASELTDGTRIIFDMGLYSANKMNLGKFSTEFFKKYGPIVLTVEQCLVRDDLVFFHAILEQDIFEVADKDYPVASAKKGDKYYFFHKGEPFKFRVTPDTRVVLA